MNLPASTPSHPERPNPRHPPQKPKPIVLLPKAKTQARTLNAAPSPPSPFQTSTPFPKTSSPKAKTKVRNAQCSPITPEPISDLDSLPKKPKPKTKHHLTHSSLRCTGKPPENNQTRETPALLDARVGYDSPSSLLPSPPFPFSSVFPFFLLVDRSLGQARASK